MEVNPKLEIKSNKAGRIVDAISFVLLAGMWIALIILYKKLPAEIPSHFNAKGEIDDYSKPSFIIMLPVVASVVYFLLSFISHYPHKLNYPSPVSPENAERKYRAAITMLRNLKLSIMIVISVILIVVFKTGFYGGPGPGIWLLPFVIIVVLSPVIYFFIKG